MGLRPRTVRRLVLAGGALVVLALGGVAFFTVPKIQKARQMESFQRDGLQAREEGRHNEAVVLLGRYIRAADEQEVDPEILLAFARSRAEWEARDGGHLAAAAGVFREYLREHPDDVEVAKELLDLYVKTGGWVEARELAGRLRPADIATTPEGLLPVLRNEVRARAALNAQDPLIREIEDRLLAAENPAFEDVWRAFGRAESASDQDRVEGTLESYRAADPDGIGPRLLSAIHGTRDFAMNDALAEVSRAIGLDTESGDWSRADEVRDDAIITLIVRILGMSRREDLSLVVLESAAEWSKDAAVARELVRRRFWENRFDEVIDQSRTTADGRYVADVDGYAALVAAARDETETVDRLAAELAEHSHDFRAVGWLKAIEARRALDIEDMVTARTRASEAIEQYATEPTMRLLIGDVHHSMGRLSDAMESWSLAGELAEPYIWLEPDYRRATAFMQAQRPIEARPIAMEMVERTGASTLGPLLLLIQIDATLARLGQVDAERAGRSLAVAQRIRDQELIEGDARRRLTLSIAALHGALGDGEAARSALSGMLSDPDLSETARAEIVTIDSRFDLGMDQDLGVSGLPERIDDPDTALQAVLMYVSEAPEGAAPERTREAIALLDRGKNASDGQSRVRWLRAEAVFKDSVGDEGASDAWRAAIEAAPDNIELLTESIESEALGRNLEHVDATIERIVQLTATQGRTLPSRLRLARANAVFGLSPTRRTRDEAVSIVRSVVTAEPQNVRARTMLANMLAFPPSPDLAERDRFSRDPAGAIDQYLAAADLVTGSQVFGYLFTVFELHRELGNEDQARQILLDIVSRAGGDPFLQQEVARGINRLSNREDATRTLQSLYAAATGPAKATIGLQLAQSAMATDDQTLVRSVLQDLVGSERLTPEQVAELAAKLRQAGMQEQSDSVISNAERYGLSQEDARRVGVLHAINTGDRSRAESTLLAAVEQDPSDVGSWLALVELVMQTGDTERALSIAERALEQHPGNENLLFWRRMAQGQPAEALRDRLTAAGADESIRLSLERVESFERDRGSMTPEQQIESLRAMTRDFPRNLALQKYALAQRFELGEQPGPLAEDSYQATRRFQGDEVLFRIAAETNLASEQYARARTIATSWRGWTMGSTLEPDLYWARAMHGLGDHRGVVDRLARYLDAALSNPEDGLNPGVIFVHSRSAIRTASSDATVRDRLEPAAMASPQFRSTTWLELAVTAVNEPGRAAAWVSAAEQMGSAGIEPALIKAWSALAERHPGQGEDFSQNAARLAGVLISRDAERFENIAIAAEAFQLWASYIPSAESAHEPYTQAETLYLQAYRQNPENPVLKFSAAICADRAGRTYEAEQYYRALLELPDTSGLFQAAIWNNLAGILARANPSPERLAEATDLIERAIGFDELAPFFSTKGWVLLAMDRTAEAVAAFERAVTLDGSSYEIVAGLAAAQHRSGSDPGLVDQTLRRAQDLARNTRPNPQLADRLRDIGLDW